MNFSIEKKMKDKLFIDFYKLKFENKFEYGSFKSDTKCFMELQKAKDFVSLIEDSKLKLAKFIPKYVVYATFNQRDLKLYFSEECKFFQIDGKYFNVKSIEKSNQLKIMLNCNL